MSLPIEELTPQQIVEELDRYIIGQAAAKRAVAVALRNRYRRQQLPLNERNDIMPKNILMIGPTGVGKTEIARRLAQLARAPFIKVEATKFTEVGYVGRDVESMVRDLAAVAVRLVEQERIEATQAEAEAAALDELVLMLDESMFGSPYASNSIYNPYGGAFSAFSEESAMEEGDVEPQPPQPTEEEIAERRKKLRAEVLEGKHDHYTVTVEVDEPAGNQFLQVFTPQGMEEMGLDMANLMGGGSRKGYRDMPVSEARAILTENQATSRIDKATLHKEALERTEQTGIIFLDEIDKIAMKGGGGSGPEVSREGVQRDLLPIIEGSTVQSKFGQIRTDHILFVAAGAFHESKPSDLIPELQGRLPIRVELENLSQDDFARILSEPKNALTKQYEKLLAVDGVTLSFSDDAIVEIAKMASEINKSVENIGARRLQTMLERLLETLLFEAPYAEPKHIHIDRGFVWDTLGSIVADAKKNKAML